MPRAQLVLSAAENEVFSISPSNWVELGLARRVTPAADARDPAGLNRQRVLDLGVGAAQRERGIHRQLAERGVDRVAPQLVVRGDGAPLAVRPRGDEGAAPQQRVVMVLELAVEDARRQVHRLRGVARLARDVARGPVQRQRQLVHRAAGRAARLAQGTDALGLLAVAGHAEVQRRIHARRDFREAADVLVLLGVVEPVPGRDVGGGRRAREREVVGSDAAERRDGVEGPVVDHVVGVQAVLEQAVAAAARLEELVVATEVLAEQVVVPGAVVGAQAEARDDTVVQVAVLVEPPGIPLVDIGGDAAEADRPRDLLCERGRYRRGKRRKHQCCRYLSHALPLIGRSAGRARRGRCCRGSCCGSSCSCGR